MHQGATGVRDHRGRSPRGPGHAVPADTEAAQAGEAEQEAGQVGQGFGGLHVRLLILSVADSLSSGDSYAFHGVFLVLLAITWWRRTRGTQVSVHPCTWTFVSRSFAWPFSWIVGSVLDWPSGCF